MVRAPRPLVALLLASVLLVAAGCGVEGGDQAARTDTGATTTTRDAPKDAPDPSDETDEPTTTTEADEADPGIPDDATAALADVYTEMGFTEDEAQCLAEQIAGSSAIDPSDATAMMDLINECDISMARLMELTETLSGGTGDLEETYKNSMAAGLRGSGLSDEQADCVASAFVDEYGTDPSMASDPTALQSMFTQCDVDPNELGG